jgi:hypothetical protein
MTRDKLFFIFEKNDKCPVERGIYHCRDRKKVPNAQSREVPSLERFISSKNSSGGFPSAQFKEVPSLERCPLKEVLL